MKLNKFITTVLNEIHTGLKDAEQSTDRRYHIDSTTQSGILFDVAVTSSESMTNTIEKSGEIGFVQVVNASLSSSSQNKENTSQVSRIRFSVWFPHGTRNEEENDIRNYSRSEKNWSIA